ncbi:MAG TPA: DUF2520 domain-containing protein [Gemmatimonadaceae bacterium]|nr:DUF2520 domain-containing protein [Gemmatimonadaceae bacterium]
MTPHGPPPRVFVLGAGRAGRALAAALAAAGVEVVGLHGRRPGPAAPPLPAVSAGPLPDALAGAEIVLVTVRDAQLDEALAELREAAVEARLAPGAVVLHASGASEPAGLAALRAAGGGHAAGTFHPLVPLHDASEAAARLRDAWIGLDGDAAALAAGRALAARLAAHPVEIPAGQKARYHAAAVMASNFPVVLASVAMRLLGNAGLPEVAAAGAVRALLAGAAANVATASPGALAAGTVLTGPVPRGDVETVARHLAALAGDERARAVYAALTTEAVETLRAGGRDVLRLAELAELLHTAADRR